MQGAIHHSFADQITLVAPRTSHKACKPLSPRGRSSGCCLQRMMAGIQVKRPTFSSEVTAWVMVIVTCIALTGCGSGGYAGSGITSLSSSAITIDAGQSFQITAALVGDDPFAITNPLTFGI